MKAAAAARKSGDPAEMAKVRDMGLKIWRDTPANKKLAAAAAERERIRGTAQTDNPLMRDMKSGLPLNSPSIQSPDVEKLGKGNQSLVSNPNAFKGAPQKPAATAKPAATSNTQVPPVTVSNNATMNKAADELSKNQLGKKKEVKTEAYDIVLDYLLSEGHADTLSEAHYIMLQMTPEHVQDVIQERAWWDPAGLFTKTAKEKALEKPASGYDPKSGTTRRADKKDVIVAPLTTGGRTRYFTQIPGNPNNPRVIASRRGLTPIAAITRLNTAYPPVQAKSVIAALNQQKNARDAAADAAFDKKYGVGSVSANDRSLDREGLGPRPEPQRKPIAKPIVSAVPKPQPPTIQSKNVTATGTSYERRTPTSAELAAAKAAGGGEAGVKAAVDVAKSNQVAATSPTPDLKPEAPKKRESLASQLADLQRMRKEAEERNK